MRLSTPKRYQPGRGQRRHLINSRRWIWLWLITPVIALAGYYIYEQREALGPPVRDFIAERLEDAQSGVATITAPTPLPTTDPTQRIARADGLWSQGAVEAALDEYQVAVEGAPNDVRVHHRYAYGLLIEGRVGDALTAAEDAVTANPFSSDAWAIRAFALARNDRYAEAIASGLQALSLDPTNSSALAYMGLAYFRAGQPAQAEQAINRALDADPENPEVYYVRGLYNFEVNFLLDDYLEDMQQAFELAPNLPHITVELAWAYWNM
ncbi:MAG: tetratricopeptide repeat protein, partial [Anaerolinea sp.]|nr:tetratricopeptide repeat protein [Anaerolinea sp.]